jgi:hypothetical protein
LSLLCPHLFQDLDSGENPGGMAALDQVLSLHRATATLAQHRAAPGAAFGIGRERESFRLPDENQNPP